MFSNKPFFSSTKQPNSAFSAPKKNPAVWTIYGWSARFPFSPFLLSSDVLPIEMSKAAKRGRWRRRRTGGGTISSHEVMIYFCQGSCCVRPSPKMPKPINGGRLSPLHPFAQIPVAEKGHQHTPDPPSLPRCCCKSLPDFLRLSVRPFGAATACVRKKGISAATSSTLLPRDDSSKHAPRVIPHPPLFSPPPPAATNPVKVFKEHLAFDLAASDSIRRRQSPKSSWYWSEPNGECHCCCLPATDYKIGKKIKLNEEKLFILKAPIFLFLVYFLPSLANFRLRGSKAYS